MTYYDTVLAEELQFRIRLDQQEIMAERAQLQKDFNPWGDSFEDTPEMLHCEEE